MKKNIIKILLILGTVSSSFAYNNYNKVYGFTEYNQLSPIENQHLGEVSSSTKKYINNVTQKNLELLYETRIKNDMLKYLTLLNEKMTKENKIILKGLIYKLSKENKKIISQNKYLLRKYSYLLRKYKEAHIITSEDLKRLMLKEAKHVNYKIHGHVSIKGKIKYKTKNQIKKTNINRTKTIDNSNLDFLFKGQ